MTPSLLALSDPDDLSVELGSRLHEHDDRSDNGDNNEPRTE